MTDAKHHITMFDKKHAHQEAKRISGKLKFDCKVFNCSECHGYHIVPVDTGSAQRIIDEQRKTNSNNPGLKKCHHHGCGKLVDFTDDAYCVEHNDLHVTRKTNLTPEELATQYCKINGGGVEIYYRRQTQDCWIAFYTPECGFPNTSSIENYEGQPTIDQALTVLLERLSKGEMA